MQCWWFGPEPTCFSGAAILPLVGAVFFASFNIVTRLIGASDQALTTLLHSSGIGLILVSIVIPLLWRHPSPTQWLLMLGAGVLGHLAHWSIVRALAVANASTLAPLNYIRIVWALGIGLVIFGQVPDAMALLGGAVIVGSGLYVIYGHSQ